jgi:hypothetical protein
MKILKRYTAGLMIIMLCLASIIYHAPIKAQAASATFTIALSATSANVGDTITATVKVTCSSAIGSCTYCLSYDDSILEYTSGSGTGGGGTLKYAGYGDGTENSITASYTFKVIGTGTASIKTGSNEVYDWDENYCAGTDAGVKVVVGGDSSEEAPDASTEATTEVTTEATEEYSDNYYLQSLEISPGTLTPEFSRDHFSYTATVSGDTESIAIDAVPEDSSALVSIDGNSDLEPDKINKITITVTAENGEQQVYYLNVTTEKLVDNRVYVSIDGIEYYFAQDYENLNIPEGFSESTASYQNQEIIIYTSPNGQLSCVCLTNDAGDENWFIYDVDNESFLPFIELSASYNRYVIMTLDDDTAIPDGYLPITYTINGTEVSAYAMNESDEIILVYAMNVEGSTGFYYYDTVENTFMRYTESSQTSEADSQVTENTSTQKDGYHLLIAAILILVIIFIAIIVLICIMLKLMKKSSH